MTLIPYRRRAIHTLFLILPGILPLAAKEPPPAPVPPTPEQGEVSESGKFEPRIAPEVHSPAPDPAARLAELGVAVDQETVRIGAVELDRRTLTVSIPATVNMREGVAEYFLVHHTGKVHESVFVTDAKPQDIHIACLLANLEPKEKPGDITLEVTWETNGPPRLHPAAELVAIAAGHPDAGEGAHLDDGPWQYTGSRIDAAGFAATREGSIIALITDPAALVGNPRPGRHDDGFHAPNRDLLPPDGHPVRILIRPR